MAFSLFRSRLFDLMDEFHEPFFNDPFFTPAPMMIDSPRSSSSNNNTSSNGKPAPKEEKRVTKTESSSNDSPFGWLSRGFRTAMDVTENKDSYSVALDVPGVKPEEIKIEVKDGRLTISGSRQHEKKESTDKYQRIERSSGSFSRSIVLPREVDQDKIAASHENGVLRLTMPKHPEKSKEPKTIAIASAPNTNSAQAPSPTQAPASTAPTQPTQPASN